jgi:membrane protein implicated in regulation of membrane protease activity
MVNLVDVAFPYRIRRSFGAASFALIFLVLLAEIEGLVFIALAIVAHRLDLFAELQPLILPGACLVALAASAVFWWRARSWNKRKIDTLDLWTQSGTAYGERLVRSRQKR